MKLTAEQKAQFAPILRATWQGIAPDADVSSRAEIIELVCDAGRPVQFGMSRADYQVLCAAYRDRDTKRWLREVLNY